MPRLKYTDWPLTELTMPQLSEALGGCIILDGESKSKSPIKKETNTQRTIFKYTADDTYIIIDRIKSGNKLIDIAREFGTDQSSISRLFRKTTGQSVKEYKRLNHSNTA